jgi:hypothetical protein
VHQLATLHLYLPTFEAIRPTHAMLSQISRVSVWFLEATGFSMLNRTWRELTARHSIINDVDGGSKYRRRGVVLPALQRMSQRMPLPSLLLETSS